MRVLLATLLVLGGTAHADHETRTELSFPFTYGGLHDDTGWHASVGWHPEMIIARSDDETGQGFGVGPFLDLSAAGKQTRAAGGATFVVYGARGRAFAVSGGVSSSGHGAVPFFGAFVGWRWSWDFPLDIPIGFRVDVRPARDAPTVTSIAFEIDAIPDLYLLYEAMQALAHMD